MKPKHRRIILFALLMAVSILYFASHFQWLSPSLPSKSVSKNRPKPLDLDEATKAEIRARFEGITIKPNENNIQYAIKLDHGTGRKLIAEGNHSAAYQVYRKLLAISYQQGSLMGVGIGLGVLSNIIYEMGNLDEALRLALLEYKVAKKLNKRFEYGVSEQRIAALLQKQDRSMSIGWRLRAKESLKGTPHHEDYVILLRDLALDLAWFDEDSRALDVARESWNQSLQLGSSPGQREAKSRVARTYAKLLKKANRCNEAIALIENFLPEYNEQERDTNAYYSLIQAQADCNRQIGKLEQAKNHYSIAYSYYEKDRTNALGDKARAKLDRSNQDLVNRLIDTFIDDGDFYTALSILETNKSRTLADISEDTGQRAIYQKLTDLQRRHANERLAFFENRIDSETHEDLEQRLSGYSHETDSEKFWQDYAQLIDVQAKQLREAQVSLQIRNVAVSNRINAEQIKSLQTKIPLDTAILSLYVNNKELSAFLLSRTGLKHWFSGLSYQQSARLIKQLRAALTNPHFDFYREPAEKLADALVNPMLKLIGDDIKTLVYSTDSLFSRIPIGVLLTDNKPLANRLTVLRVPSLRYVNFQAEDAHVNRGVSCVDPEVRGSRLPFQRDTGNFLETLYSGNLTSLSGADCTSDRLISAIQANQTPSFLHVGAHGFFYQNDPMQSGVLLSSEQKKGQGELWNAKAIGTVNLENINLITFSSCDTGMIDTDFTRDIFGLHRTLFFGRARAVVSPLWAVQDEATSQLMQTFYKHFARGLRPEEALQKSQRSLINSSRYSHPYFWSGFYLIRGEV